MLVKQRLRMLINECLSMEIHHPHHFPVNTTFNESIRFFLRLGGMAIGIPGEIAGFWKAHKRYGRLPWSALFSPAIDMCNQGIEINKALAFAILKNKKKLYADKSMR